MKFQTERLGSLFTLGAVAQVLHTLPDAWDFSSVVVPDDLGRMFPKQPCTKHLHDCAVPILSASTGERIEVIAVQAGCTEPRYINSAIEGIVIHGTPTIVGPGTARTLGDGEYFTVSVTEEPFHFRVQEMAIILLHTNEPRPVIVEADRTEERPRPIFPNEFVR
ncbi:MAG: hypothetical protein HY341_02485 [Candidatus Kerfeldbacteria bacterium]|nr:hypothetical protein [Candidatus Kerfeldbacteria bacterium]